MKRIFLLGTLISSSLISFSQLSPLSIGTIPAGDSIVVKYNVNINTPLPGGTTQISNQGTCSGSNFSNTLTDDPDTGPANDPTITLLNVFPLPVTLIDFRASLQGSSIVLNWKVAAEYDLLKYEIERSSDAAGFGKIGETAARNSTGEISYSFTDGQPFNGNNFYRLKMIDIDGKVKYSVIVKVRFGGSAESVVTYPNPVLNSSFAVQFSNIKKGNYQLEIYNSMGSLVYNKGIIHAGGSSTQIVFINEVAAGSYHLRITGENLRFTKTIIVH